MSTLEILRLVAEIILAVVAAGGFKNWTDTKKYRQEVEKLRAEVESAKTNTRSNELENVKKAMAILMEEVVEPLKKELSATRREMARLRKAIDGANDCLHRADCPVLHELRELPKTDPELDDGENRVRRGQRKVRASGAGDGGPPGIGADVENSGS